MVRNISMDCREALLGLQENTIPALPEDWLLRGTPSMKALHERITFGFGTLGCRMEQTIVRCFSLISLGCKFAEMTSDLGIDFAYDVQSKTFVASAPSDTVMLRRSHAPVDVPPPRKNRRQSRRTDSSRTMNQPDAVSVASRCATSVEKNDDLAGLGQLPSLGSENVSRLNVPTYIL